ncbi:MAG: hypothetical protein ABL866_02765 [Devosia sp.]
MVWWDKVRKFALDLLPKANRFATVVYETPSMTGHEDSLFQWRVKRRDDGVLLVSLKLVPDYVVRRAGGEGGDGPTESYIDFAPEDENQIKAALDACVAECERIKAQPAPVST